MRLGALVLAAGGLLGPVVAAAEEGPGPVVISTGPNLELRLSGRIHRMIQVVEECGSMPGFAATQSTGLAAMLAVTVPLRAQGLSPEEEAARKASDPLGSVKALMTDNTIAFKAGESEDDTTFGFQVQPVYAIPNSTRFNMIARAVVPVLGVEPGVVAPPIGGEPRPQGASKWGLSDSQLQFFVSPKTDGSLKWGVGPQVSLKTRTSDPTP